MTKWRCRRERTHSGEGGGGGAVAGGVQPCSNMTSSQICCAEFESLMSPETKGGEHTDQGSGGAGEPDPPPPPPLRPSLGLELLHLFHKLLNRTNVGERRSGPNEGKEGGRESRTGEQGRGGEEKNRRQMKGGEEEEEESE